MADLDKKPDIKILKLEDPSEESSEESFEQSGSEYSEDDPYIFIEYASNRTLHLNEITTKEGVVGFGVYEKPNGTLLTTEELISAQSYYDMVKSNEYAESSNRQKIIAFIPCLTNSKNASIIEEYLGDGFRDLIKEHVSEEDTVCCFLETITSTICKLITNTLKEFLLKKRVDDDVLITLFMLHRLLLWLFCSNICVRENAHKQRKELENFVKNTSSKNTTHLNNVFLLACITELR